MRIETEGNFDHDEAEVQCRAHSESGAEILWRVAMAAIAMAMIATIMFVVGLRYWLERLMGN